MLSSSMLYANDEQVDICVVGNVVHMVVDRGSQYVVGKEDDHGW